MLANIVMFAGMFGGGNRNSPLEVLEKILVALLPPMATMLVQMAGETVPTQPRRPWG